MENKKSESKNIIKENNKATELSSDDIINEKKNREKQEKFGAFSFSSLSHRRSDFGLGIYRFVYYYRGNRICHFGYS